MALPLASVPVILRFPLTFARALLSARIGVLGVLFVEQSRYRAVGCWRSPFCDTSGKVPTTVCSVRSTLPRIPATTNSAVAVFDAVRFLAEQVPVVVCMFPEACKFPFTLAVELVSCRMEVEGFAVVEQSKLRAVWCCRRPLVDVMTPVLTLMVS